MNGTERLNLVGPCGIDCGICELYACRSDEKLFNTLVGMGIPREKLPCAGCRPVKGRCPVIGETCATYACAEEKQVKFCSDCAGFPCARLNPAADRANILPHNTKVFNLCTIKRIGLKAFTEKSAEIKLKYYQGKMAVGKGPQLG